MSRLAMVHSTNQDTGRLWSPLRWINPQGSTWTQIRDTSSQMPHLWRSNMSRISCSKILLLKSTNFAQKHRLLLKYIHPVAQQYPPLFHPACWERWPGKPDSYMFQGFRQHTLNLQEEGAKFRQTIQPESNAIWCIELVWRFDSVHAWLWLCMKRSPSLAWD